MVINEMQTSQKPRTCPLQPSESLFSKDGNKYFFLLIPSINRVHALDMALVHFVIFCVNQLALGVKEAK